MKKLSIITIVLSILFALNLNAQSKYWIKIGGNYSFLKKLSYSEPGMDIMYGIGKDWQLYRWIQLRTELLISNSTTALKDRSVHTTEIYKNFPYLPNEATGYTDIR